MTVPERRLGADVEALLRAEIAAPNPPLHVRERVWANVDAAIANGAADLGGSASSSGGGVAAKVSSVSKGLAAGKWSAGLAIVAAGATCAVLWQQGQLFPFSAAERAESPRAGQNQVDEQPGFAAVAVVPDAPAIGVDEEHSMAAEPSVPRAVEPEQPAMVHPLRPMDRGHSLAATVEVRSGAARDRVAIAPHRQRAVVSRGAPETGASTKRHAPVAAKLAKHVGSAGRAGRSAAAIVTPAPGEGIAAETETGDTGGLEKELIHLRRARAAVVAGRHQEAITHVDAHAKAFANGQLAEERDALRVHALAALGRHDEAINRAQAFKDKYPGSLMWSAVRRAVSSGGAH